MLSEAFIQTRNTRQNSSESPCPHMNEKAKRQAPGIIPFLVYGRYTLNTSVSEAILEGLTPQLNKPPNRTPPLYLYNHASY